MSRTYPPVPVTPIPNLIASISGVLASRNRKLNVHIEVQKYVYISLFNATIQDIRACTGLFLTSQTTSACYKKITISVKASQFLKSPQTQNIQLLIPNHVRVGVIGYIKRTLALLDPLHAAITQSKRKLASLPKMGHLELASLNFWLGT